MILQIIFVTCIHAENYFLLEKNRLILIFSNLLGVQKSSELFFVKFNLYSKTNEKIWFAA